METSGPAWQSGQRVGLAIWRSRFDSRPCHVVVALGKQFTLTFPSPPTCKMGTQLQAILEFVICACNALHMGLKWPSNVLVCWCISGAALVATQLR
ncbi:hypothetical protein ElyMa_005676300 [Elysia marginata]|uniref:Uncharacterized protein n=1 Tax=Elysia marginata TaxID=1093978 RepID=A0AAV4FE18_9GAST|nr:hypothetical protein ElyMa_005676300 [Elysia marginata]